MSGVRRPFRGVLRGPRHPDALRMVDATTGLLFGTQTCEESSMDAEGDSLSSSVLDVPSGESR